MKCQLEGNYSQAVLDFLEKKVWVSIILALLSKKENTHQQIFQIRERGNADPFHEGTIIDLIYFS